MLPAGLGMLWMSEGALARVEGCPTPRSFFDLRPMRANNAQGYFPSTPALSLLFGLEEALTMLVEEEGMAAVAARHAHLARGVRAAVAAWGLTTVARRPAIASDTVTAIVVPEGIDARHVITHAFARHDLALGSGLAELNGRVFRIGHLGDMNALTLAAALAGTEMAMADAGMTVAFGSGVGAALGAWQGARAS
jgi:alanine-glyoxylate transaminase/serine-glyoxylate transaminase/serine-pyruvate transaminase